jgi:hypothetical protein
MIAISTWAVNTKRLWLEFERGSATALVSVSVSAPLPTHDAFHSTLL